MIDLYSTLKPDHQKPTKEAYQNYLILLANEAKKNPTQKFLSLQLIAGHGFHK